MYNIDPAHPQPPSTIPLKSMPSWVDSGQLDRQLYARILCHAGGNIREIDDYDYLPLPICMARFGPAEWRVPYPFWFGGLARPNLHIDIYDTSDRLLFTGALPALRQNGRTAEASLYSVWFNGEPVPILNRREVWAAPPVFRQG